MRSLKDRLTSLWRRNERSGAAQSPRPAAADAKKASGPSADGRREGQRQAAAAPRRRAQAVTAPPASAPALLQPYRDGYVAESDPRQSPRSRAAARDDARASLFSAAPGLSPLASLRTLLAQGPGKQGLARGGEWFAAHGFASPSTIRAQTFKLLVTDKYAWMLGRTAYSGAYGKVHLAQAITLPHGKAEAKGDHASAPPLRVAIKEQRLRPKAAGPRGAKTEARSFDAIADEAEAFAGLRLQIEAVCRHYELLQEASSGITLTHVAGPAAPTEVLDFYVDEAKQKVYMATTLEVGDAAELRDVMAANVQSGFDADVLRVVSTSFAYQTLLEVSALHSVGRVAHLDLKLQNVTYNAQGRFKLMDFGMVLPLADDGTVNRHGLGAGSLLAPEMVLYHLRRDGVGRGRLPASTATDVHALCASTLNLIAGPNLVTPFYKPRVRQQATASDGRTTERWGPVDREEAVAIVLACERLAEAVATSSSLRRRLTDALEGPLLLDVILGSERPWIAEFFSSCLRTAPELTLTLLPGLRADPARRPDAFTLSTACGLLLPRNDGRVPRAVRRLFAEAPQQRAHEQAFAQMDRYTELLAAGR